MPGNDAMHEIKEEARRVGWKTAQEYLQADEAERARQGLRMLLSAAIKEALSSTDMSHEYAERVADSFRKAIGEEIAQLKLETKNGKQHLAESDYRLFYKHVYDRVAMMLAEN